MMLLIEKGADINIADLEDRTILDLLAKDNYEKEKKDKSTTILREGSIDAHNDEVIRKTIIIKYLIKKGAKIDESMLFSPIYNKHQYWKNLTRINKLKER